MRKLRKSKALQVFLALWLVALMVIPAGIAFAETPTVTSTVLSNAGNVLGDTYQRHSFNAEGLHWVFYTTSSASYYTSSADADTWATPTKFDDYTCDLEEGCCNGSTFALWYNSSSNLVDIAFMNVSGNHSIYYDRGTPVNDGTITWTGGQEAVATSANLTYSHPSICVNTNTSPFITYMVYNGSAYSANISTSITNDGTWTAATNSTVSTSTTLNLSVNIYYPSVVPVTSGNVSLMAVVANGSEYILAQNYMEYNVSTDLWDCPATSQFPLPATSVIDAEYLWLHSEVAWSGNESSPDDVYLLAVVNDSIVGGKLFFDRYGDPETPWTSDVNLASNEYYSSLSIRNTDGDLTLTAIEASETTELYSADYSQTTGNWTALVAVVTATITTSNDVMSDYDNAGTDYLGMLFANNGELDDLDYGCYGCPAIVTPVTPSTIPASVTTMAWIVILVFGTFICLALLAYGTYETVKGRGGSELVKVGAIGLVTFIIAAIIVENLL